MAFVLSFRSHFRITKFTEQIRRKSRMQVETVDLPLEGLGELSGRVVSMGRGISAARVWVIPPDRGAAAASPTETSVDGTFTVQIPVGARHVTLIATAPGFGLSFADLPLPTNDIELAITPDAATLDLDVADSEQQYARGFLPTLIHRGTFLPVALAACVSGTAERRRASERCGEPESR